MPLSTLTSRQPGPSRPPTWPSGARPATPASQPVLRAVQASAQLPLPFFPPGARSG